MGREVVGGEGWQRGGREVRYFFPRHFQAASGIPLHSQRANLQLPSEKT
jgi:hypothetical protein